MSDLSMYYNPQCSKCRTAQGLLAERGIDAEIIEYLEQPPTVEQLRELMVMLGIENPRNMMRTGEAVYAERGLEMVHDDDLLEAIAQDPILLERPIVVKDGRAVIARPPELLLDLL